MLAHLKIAFKTCFCFLNPLSTTACHLVSTAVLQSRSFQLLSLSWQMNIHELEHCQMKLLLLPLCIFFLCIVGKSFKKIKGELFTKLYVKNHVVFFKTFLTFRSQLNSFTPNFASGAQLENASTGNPRQPCTKENPFPK